MTPQCNSSYLDFPLVGSRQVLADFDGGEIISDGGGLLLRQTKELTDIIPRALRQGSGRSAGGRPGVGLRGPQDHDALRLDPPLATVVGKNDPPGAGAAVPAPVAAPEPRTAALESPVERDPGHRVRRS
jgi:hypothetical protein